MRGWRSPALWPAGGRAGADASIADASLRLQLGEPQLQPPAVDAEILVPDLRSAVGDEGRTDRLQGDELGTDAVDEAEKNTTLLCFDLQPVL